MLCTNCTHYDRKHMTEYGMAPCTKEPPPYRLARVFSPSARCNKNQFQPVPRSTT